MFESTVRNPHGLITRGDEQGKLIELDSVQCCHCGAHFEIVKGSGRIRGYCFGCGSLTCGAKDCDAHIPFQAKIDHAEGRRTSFTAAILEQERNKAAIQHAMGGF